MHNYTSKTHVVVSENIFVDDTVFYLRTASLFLRSITVKDIILYLKKEKKSETGTGEFLLMSECRKTFGKIKMMVASIIQFFFLAWVYFDMPVEISIKPYLLPCCIVMLGKTI